MYSLWLTDAARKNIEERGNMDMFLKNLHQRTQAIPGTPAKRLKVTAEYLSLSAAVSVYISVHFCLLWLAIF